MNKPSVSNKPADIETKKRAITLIRDHGISVPQAAKQVGYSDKAVYRWVKEGVEATGSSTNFILENNRLKKELEQAYALLGRATAEMKRSKN
jgi:transposase-like protein